jgi:two-component system CheB/CheR fusion protein
LLLLAKVALESPEAIIIQDLKGNILAWNPSATTLYGWTEEQALSLNSRMRIPEMQQSLDQDKLASLIRKEELQPYSSKRITTAGNVLEMIISAIPLNDETGQIYAIAFTEKLKKSIDT